jgi:RNA polymerase sigma-70 factor (ECF subfamily)
MQDSAGSHGPDAFEARYLAFLETVTHLRPSLHRYCSRMTGSVMDGEDIVEEALFHGFRRLDTYDDARPLSPWLFRIADNSCVDFLRSREVRQSAEAAAMEPDTVPMERACVLLKDVLDYSLEEIADLVDSTPGSVKSA